MRVALLAVVTAALSHSACAPLAYQMTPSPERAEQLRVEDGVDYIVSEGTMSRVRAGAAGHNAAQEFLAVVWVENLTDADHVFLPAEHISATITRFDGEESEETPLTVYAYDAYLETLKKRAEAAGTSMGAYGHSGIGFYFGGATRGPWGSSWHHPKNHPTPHGKDRRIPVKNPCRGTSHQSYAAKQGSIRPLNSCQRATHKTQAAPHCPSAFSVVFFFKK